MFLPFIGFYLVGQNALRPVARMFKKSTTEIAASMSPGLQPGTAHLTGRDGEKPAEGTETKELSALEGKIAAKRTKK
jgi:hypothetical protein